MARPVVAFATLGGTIAMTPHANSGAIRPRLNSADLLATVPDLTTTAEIRATDLAALPSASLTPATVVDVIDWAEREVAGGASGVVVSQGSDTVEETAYLASLYWSRDEPLVFTAAMRGPRDLSSDGPANLMASFTVALHAGSRGRGVVVVLDNVVHAAALVRKEHSHSLAAFRSEAPGPLAALMEGRVRFYRDDIRPAPVGRPRTDPFVALHESHLGDGDRSVRALLDAGADGLVVAGFGAGHVPASTVPVLAEAATRIPVIVASRTGHGGTLTRTYGFAGSEVDLLARGVQLAGLLDHRKARLLTWALLASGVPYPAEFAALFQRACPTYD